jgi:SAM-dependent methyltransferase
MDSNPESFDRFAADYDRYLSLMPGQDSPWVAGLGLYGERALDAGCGSGHTATVLAKSFGEVIGIDLSGSLIRLAKEKRANPNIRYIAGDLFAFRDENKFDLVYSHTMMHHAPDYLQGLSFLKNLVKPGGAAVIVDNVCDQYPTPPRIAYTLPAKIDFIKEIFSLGWGNAVFNLKFRHDKAWLSHLLSDKYLSGKQFVTLYLEVFPGAQFEDFGYALGMKWTAPAEG